MYWESDGRRSLTGPPWMGKVSDRASRAVRSTFQVR